jgi:hypothetical protein
MKCIGNHTYVVGKQKIVVPTAEQSIALAFDDNIEVFSRLFKDGVLYYSSSWKQGNKRDNIHCAYNDGTGEKCFGIIEIFTSTPKPCAFIRQLTAPPTTLINEAGHPCRTCLTYYQQVDLLDSYITPVKVSTNLSAVPIDSIISKAVIISVSQRQYCIVHPNNIEHH